MTGAVWSLTGSARLFGDGQGDLREGEDVDLGAVLGGGRGRGGRIRLVLLSIGVVKLLVQRCRLRLVGDALPLRRKGERHSSPRRRAHTVTHTTPLLYTQTIKKPFILPYKGVIV